MPVPDRPRATLRLQFEPGFDFAAARAVLPYARALGMSHIYASPLLQARPGSTHGYDVADPARIGDELGGEDGFAVFVAELHRLGLGLILDIVPNHMGTGPANPWWTDMLEWGEQSPHAAFFDVDWRRGTGENGVGKVVLPVLGDAYGACLARGEITLDFVAEAGGFVVRYFDNVYPVGPVGYADLLRRADTRLPNPSPELGELAAEFAVGTLSDTGVRQKELYEQTPSLKAELAELVGDRDDLRAAIADTVADINAGDADGGRPGLHYILESQAYRLAFWRAAPDEINYRRFFDINELAGLRVEDPAVFEASHARVLRAVAEGQVQGLRIDHIDGLFDPLGYLRRLQAEAAERGPSAPPVADGQPLYVLVEKILAEGEPLPESWPIAGTTGYDYMNDVLGVFVDPAAEGPMTADYETLSGETDFGFVTRRAKRERLAQDFASEVDSLTAKMLAVAKRDPLTRDVTANGLRRALCETVVAFPVYRTYADAEGPGPRDREVIAGAIREAEDHLDLNARFALPFLESVLTIDPKAAAVGREGEMAELARRFQQFTGPIMAKAFEDTAFYRYHRLAALNEVGGEPGRFGVTVESFHKRNAERNRTFPLAMLATATHDHKRGEDVRARLAVLSELPGDWAAAFARWREATAGLQRDVEGLPAPGANIQYLFYQVLVGAWPLDLAPDDADGLSAYADRLSGFMQKAVREAKRRTAWTAVDEDYEATVEAYLRGVLDPARDRDFLANVAGFVRRIEAAGAVNGLAQTLLKLTSPGLPDTYQGADYWDMSLVDPDNRRPVDYALRKRTLAETTPPEDLALGWRDGRIKQRLIARTLNLRARHPEAFDGGDYRPLKARGPMAEHVVAFARSGGGVTAVTVVPRLVAGRLAEDGTPCLRPDAFVGTELLLDGLEGPWRDALTGAEHPAGDALPLDGVFAVWPAALLTSG